MLEFKIKELMEKKGIIKPFSYLKSQLKIAPKSITQLLNGTQKSMNRTHISKICKAFDCTPNDLFYWDNTHDKLPETHPLLTDLKTPEKISNWNSILHKLPKEKVDELFELAKQALEKKM
jgi:DNA-binding Xre family transcriptional regulator